MAPKQATAIDCQQLKNACISLPYKMGIRTRPSLDRLLKKIDCSSVLEGGKIEVVHSQIVITVNSNSRHGVKK